jgi:hypothetical protein
VKRGHDASAQPGIDREDSMTLRADMRLPDADMRLPDMG